MYHTMGIGAKALGVTVLATLFPIQLVAAQVGQTTLTCELSLAEVQPGGSSTVDVFLTGGDNIRGYQVAIEIMRTSGTGQLTVPCPAGTFVTASRPDWLFFGLQTQSLEPSCSNCGIVEPDCQGQRLAVARVSGGVDAGASSKYLGSFTLDLSPAAAPGSTFEVRVLPYPASIIGDTANNSIPISPANACVVTVIEGPMIPTVTEWGMVLMTLLLLAAGTALLRRRPAQGNPPTTTAAALFLVLSLLICPTVAQEACQQHADCDDSDVCSIDRCGPDGCIHTPRRSGDLRGPVSCSPDGIVDQLDINEIRAGFRGASGCGCSAGDQDVIGPDNTCASDGAVDLFDIFAVLSAFAGQSTCSCPTPRTDVEPPMGNEPACPGACRTCEDGTSDLMDRVYLFSGEFYLSATDLRIPGRGLDFAWVRKYRSKIGPNTAQGNGWDFSYNLRLEAFGSDLILHNGNSRSDRYELQPDESWARREFFRTIEQNPDGSYTLNFPDTGVWEFNPLNGSTEAGKIARIADRNDNTMAFEYDGLGRLVRIHDSLDTPAHNRDVMVAYNAAGFIKSVTDFAGRSTRYEYYNGIEPGGNFGDLKSVTTPAVFYVPDFPIPPGHEYPSGKTTIYTYSTGFVDDRLNHNLLTITDPKGQTCLVNEYDPTTDAYDLNFDRIRRQRWGGSSDIIDLVYVAQTPTVANNFAIIKVIYNDRVGNVKEFLYDSANRRVNSLEYTGRANPGLPTTETTNRPTGKLRLDDPDFFESRFEYNADSLRTRVVYPNGNEEVFTYDSDNAGRRSQGNVLSRCRLPGPLGGDQAQICESFEYDGNLGGCCGTNFVTRHVDGRGNQTLHTYDANGNRIQTTHRIPSIVEDWEYNAFGQMTAHVLPDNGNGYRQRDEMTYFPSGPQNGYLAQEVTDVNGFALVRGYDYDIVGHRIREVDPRGNDTLYVYNQQDQLVRESSRKPTTGSGVRYEKDAYYDANDNVVRIDELNVDDQGIIQANSHYSTMFEYDCLNNQFRACQETGHALLTPYDRDCASFQFGQSITNEYEYDANRNITLIRHGQAVNGSQPSNTVRLIHDERDLIYGETQAEGTPAQTTTQYEYDGNRNRTTERAGLESAPRVTLTSYDGYNRLRTKTDAMGNAITNGYDANGNRVSTLTEGQLVDVIGGVNNIRLAETLFVHDPMDRLIQTDVGHFEPESQAPIGDGWATTITIYSDTSNVLSVIDDNGHGTITTYDTANRESVITDAKGNTRTKWYDVNSNVVSVTEVERSDLGNPDQVFLTTSVYDNLDRLIQTIDNAGNTHSDGYDSRNNPTRTIDALGRETRYVYDGADRLAVTTRDMDSDGADGDGTDIVTYQIWDDSLRLIAQVDGNGNATQYAYDALDRLIVTQMCDGTIHQVGTGAVWPLGDPEPNLTSFVSGYDVHDNKVRIQDANGSTVNSNFDLLNRVTNRSIIRASGVLGTTIESYQYDGLSRLVWAQDNDSIVLRSYDSMENVISETVTIQPSPGQTVGTATAAYDGAGNQVSCTYPGGRSLAVTYEDLDRKSVIADSSGTIATYSYVGPDRVERREYPSTRTDYVYDGITGVPNPGGDFGVKNIIRTTHTRIIGGLVIDDRTYLWDRMDNKTRRRDVRTTGLRWTHDYTYDSVYRLRRTFVTDTFGIVVRDTGYDLDGGGNRANVTGPPNPGPYFMDPAWPEPADYYVNQYTTTSFDSRSYDLNGNLTIAYLGQPNQQTTVYDYRNQVVQLTGGAAVHTYAYDALGRRIQKIVDSTGTPQVNRFFSFGKQEIEEQDGTGVTLATFVYGNYIDEVLNMRRGGIDYFYHGDDLHNVMAVTDAGGTVVERYEYEDYGAPQFMDAGGAPIGQSVIGNSLLFTGRRFDPESGLYYFRSRYLDPVAGRFTTRDPIGIWGDNQSMGNGYTYAGNNPWSAVDPEGHGWLKKVMKKIRKTVMGVVKQIHQVRKAIERTLRSVARFVKFAVVILVYPRALNYNYGNYCGLRRDREPKPPRDGLDACCRAHDRCATEVGVVLLASKKDRDCNRRFCDCMRDSDCLGYANCKIYRARARALSCHWP